MLNLDLAPSFLIMQFESYFAEFWIHIENIRTPYLKISFLLISY